MPKTYNSRQLNDLRLEAEHAAPLPAEPDLTRYVRPFTAEEINAIIERIERRVAAGKVALLRPETAHLVAPALRRYMAEPSRDSIVREICGIRDGCDEPCVGCIGKANAIMALYAGRKVRD
jgi:hypothetical protein